MIEYSYRKGTVTLTDDTDPSRVKVISIKDNIDVEVAAFFGPPAPEGDAVDRLAAKLGVAREDLAAAIDVQAGAARAIKGA